MDRLPRFRLETNDSTRRIRAFAEYVLAAVLGIPPEGILAVEPLPDGAERQSTKAAPNHGERQASDWATLNGFPTRELNMRRGAW